jgi:acylphosphatase
LTPVSDRVAVRVLVSGRVQGVWFRDACRNEAARLGVTGWVGNREDGRVEVVAEGPEHAVAALVSWARIGPPRADVHDVAVEYIEATGATTFVIR